ncbi:unnamed protein product [Paramecium sonneborni]|uniref:G domain-containing protein n=1 Tax=Paramecium sonneborni TaxID=65129 RepID=A0A8S1Q2E7_9CILI|nr:unnamed protein product [Paramecium sonneborni]
MGSCCKKNTRDQVNQIENVQNSQVAQAANNTIKQNQQEQCEIINPENDAIKKQDNTVFEKQDNNAIKKREYNACLPNIEETANKRTNNQNGEIKQIQNREIQQIQLNKKYLMLLGTAGVGKSRLFKQLGFSDVSNETTNFLVGNQKEYYFIDTPSFQLEDDIDTREKIIKQFQDYFDKQKQISSFCIVVNFERTDLMKKKVLSVLKYMRKFINIISIIIVNMELSQNQKQDEKHLEDSFKFMNYNKILFIQKDMNSEEIIKQIKDIKFQETQIDLTDTIFEKLTQSEENRQLQEIQNKMQQRF